MVGAALLRETLPPLERETLIVQPHALVMELVKFSGD